MNHSFLHDLIFCIGRDGPKGDIGGRCQECRPGDKGAKGDIGLNGSPGLRVKFNQIYIFQTVGLILCF